MTRAQMAALLVGTIFPVAGIWARRPRWGHLLVRGSVGTVASSMPIRVPGGTETWSVATCAASIESNWPTS
jgi:hypothetical protein